MFVFCGIALGQTSLHELELLFEHDEALGQAEQASLAMHALGRLGEPEDVAAAIAWLLDPRQSWVTGQVIGIDGGLGSVRPRG